MKPNRNIAVLLTCHNRLEKTLICLDSLFNAEIPTNHAIEVFLVDDGSTDGTGETVKTVFPSVNIIQGNGQLYWNRGMRLAWETAHKKKNYEFYLWLNDDVHLFYDALVGLIRLSNTYPESICIGAMRSKEQKYITYSGLNKKGEIIIPCGSPQRVYLFHGNLVLVPLNVYEILGFLDKDFHHAIGDFDYALRAEKKGIAKYLAPEYTGFCEKHETLPIWCLPKIALKSRLKALYSPLGNSHPYYFFRYERRHYGLMRAMKHFCTIHLRVLLPQLWKTKE